MFSPKRNFATLIVLTMIIIFAWHTNLANAQLPDYLVKDGLVSYWSFDEKDTKGRKVDDLAGDNQCEQVGALEVVEGRVGEALLYDGIENGVTCGNDASLANIFDGGGTFMAWENPRGMGQNDQGRLGDKNQWTLMQRFEGRGNILYVHAAFTTTAGAWRSPIDTFEFNEWYHGALVYDSSSDQNDPMVFVDGVNQELTVKTVPEGDYVDDTESIFGIGIRFHDLKRFFDGTLDEVAIYNRALSEAEVRQNYDGLEGTAVAPADKLAITWAAVKTSR